MEFEINLLTKKQRTFRGETFKKGGLIILLLVLGLGIIVFLSIHAKLITKKTTQVVSSGQEFLKISMEKEKVSSLVKLLFQLQKERVLWADKLRALSDATPDQVFLTSMEFKREKLRTGGSSGEPGNEKVVLHGVVITPAGEDPSSSMQRFMEGLKKNPSFMSGLVAPILVSVSNARQEEGQRESLDFEFHLLRKIEN